MLKRWAVILFFLAAMSVAGFYALQWHHDTQIVPHVVREAMLRLHREARTLGDFHKAHGRLPRDAAEAKLSLGPSMHVREMRYAGGELTAVVRGVPEVEGKALRLKAEPTGAGLRWHCFAEGFPLRSLSPACRPDSR